MTMWIAIIGMALITFALRYTLFGLAGQFRFPAWLERALHYVAPSVLAAIVFPAVLMPAGQLDISIHNAYLLGAIVAILVSVWRRNLLLTIVLSLGIFLLLRWISI